MKHWKCWFKHNWSDWAFYNRVDDPFYGSYSGKSAVIEYLPVFHFRVCDRCGKKEEHDLRPRPLTATNFMDGKIKAVEMSDEYWTEWRLPRSHYEKDCILSPQKESIVYPSDK